MTRGRELATFAVALAVILGGFFGESLRGGKILSSADVLLASASFREVAPANFEPQNRLLMDPTLQFEPWIEFNRRMLRSGRLPLWNSASGCGAPHLANGQAAVFDPFLLIAYLGPLPDAFAWMAAARLCFTGLGMFLLARAFGLGGWGRWFAGLTWPLCGFLVVWLLYPVTNAAIWMPWVFLATLGVWDRPTGRRAGFLALSVAGTLLGGHVQTAAHVLLAAGAYAGWLTFQHPRFGRAALLWSGGVGLGIALAAIEVVPLAGYLTLSPVWGDRDQERTAPWKLVRPRALEAVCTAFPSIYGSQRRGEPNLARAVGADNQNESAGGYAGVATLIWLAPLAWRARRDRPWVSFIIGLTLVGAAAAFRLPPIDNLLRLLPVLKVTDNRRMTLWVAFGLTILGGVGIDRLEQVRFGPGWRNWTAVWLLGAVVMIVVALGLPWFAPAIKSRVLAHYAQAARKTPGADPAEFRARAQRQTEATLHFVPRTLGITAAELILLASLLAAYRRNWLKCTAVQATLLGLTVTELFRFGYGLNPAIHPGEDRPMTRLIADLQRRVGDSGRIIGLGAEFPPNALMRYGLRDARNYDSVETQRNLDWLQPLFDPTVAAQTSRRDITWERVANHRDRLSQAGVRAVIAATPPPLGFDAVTRYEAVWVAWLEARPMIELDGPVQIVSKVGRDGRFDVEVLATSPTRLVIRETFDPGWRAEVNGMPVPIEPYRQTFLAIAVPRGPSRIVVRYDPDSVRWAWILSGFAALALVFALTGSLDFRSTRSVVPRLGRTLAVGLEPDL